MTLLLAIFCITAGIAIAMISIRTLRQAIATGIMPARWRTYPKATRPRMYWLVMGLHATLLLVFAPVCFLIGGLYLRRLIG